MRLNRDFVDNLFIESYSAGFATHSRQKLVIKPFTPA